MLSVQCGGYITLRNPNFCGLFTLLVMDFDLNLDVDICPKHGNTSNWGSESEYESEFKSVQCEHVLYRTI